MTTKISRLKCVLSKSRISKLHEHFHRGMCTAQECSDKDNIIKIEDKTLQGETMENEDLVEPTTCCMSGCANCVWIEYAEKLSQSLRNSTEDVQKLIMDKVQDPNMRAFLSMELRCRKLI